MDIRQMRIEDIPLVQRCNVVNIPENYFAKYYMYHLVCWPQLSYVAVDVSRTHPREPPKIVGYVLGKLDEEAQKGTVVAQITNLSLSRTHRRLGIAEKLMRQTQRAMAEVYGAKELVLHVRVGNIAAISLYNKLGFEKKRTEPKYYDDKEDACVMRNDISGMRIPFRDGLVTLSTEEKVANAMAAKSITTGQEDEGEDVGSLESAHNVKTGIREVVERMEGANLASA